MSEDMRQWKQFASSRLSSFKGYLAQRDPRPLSPTIRAPVGESANSANTIPARQSWSQWAGDKIKRRNQGNDIDGVAIERMSLFPGWAARRFHEPGHPWQLRNGDYKNAPSQEEPHFDVEIFVSGFASRLNNPESMSRSQRAFLRLAKGFASLPKLQANPAQVANSLANPGDIPLTKSTEDLLASVNLPPPPSEMSEAAEAQALEEQFRKLTSQDDGSSSTNGQYDQFYRPRTPSASSIASTASSSSTNLPLPTAQQSGVISNLHELHANLEARLQPFWASAIANRTIRLSIYSSEDSVSAATALSTQEEDSNDPNLRPILTREVTTGSDGSFIVKFHVPWDSLCTHPGGLHIAFGDQQTEHSFYVLAELLPYVSPPSSPTEYRQRPAPPFKPTPVFGTNIKVPLTFAPVRVISDIDDTVKIANVLSGARAVFHTVFVQRLADIIIPGMGEWYMDMWERGVRFHYVSNGPYEMLPVLNEFFQLASLPPGSIRLRSYGGRSLFNGLLSAPAARKRQGVIDILESFPESQFILVGDSGEQDLELYASISAERPHQVLAVFIRDVRTRMDGEEPKPLEDPVGARAALRRRSTGPPSPGANASGVPPRESRVRRALSVTATTPRAAQPITRTSSGTVKPRPGDYFTSQGSSYPPARNEAWVNEQIVEEPEPVYTPGGGRQKISDSELRRLDLQMRVDKARMEIPDHIPFRVFRSPEECIESKRILDQAQGPRVPLYPSKESSKNNLLIEI